LSSVPIAALARIVRVSTTFVVSFASNALPRSATVEWNAFLFASSALERHSAATKADPATPSTTISAPIMAARRLTDARCFPIGCPLRDVFEAAF
jgi:hypothetical protein